MKVVKRQLSDDALWNKISAGMEEFSNEKNRTYLTRAINELPDYQPSDKIWNRIENELGRTIPFYQRNSFRIAAVIILLFVSGAVVYYINNQSVQKRFAYSEEEILPVPEIPAVDSTLNNYLAEQCAAVPDKCENPRFEELRNRYEQLEKTQAHIKASLEENPGNENMIACIMRIENDKIQIKKQLLKYFTS